jgi:Aerotolerance regulator N-terminal/von Willebrand factor type A domain/CARDB
MSFLSAAFLIALPLVAVPVAIHLYRGRQRDVILWGAMQFLAAAVTKGRRMERLEELLLMALRFAAVAALVLALARPMVRSSWLGNSTDREVILLLDNSLSMSRQIDGESAAVKMKEQALAVVDSLSLGDGVQILLAAASEWATAEPIAADSAGRQRLRKIVEEAEPTLGSADLLACLQAAVHLQAENEPAGRRIVVFTDNQASGWRTDAAGAWQQLKADCDTSAFPITIEVVDCGLEAAEVENLAVTGVRTAKNLVRPGEQLDLVADIVNTGDVATGKTTVEWLLADKVAHTAPISELAAGAATQTTGSVRMAEAGIISVTCRITGSDEVPLDQENLLVIEVADRLPILFVEGNTEAKPSVAASELFAAALGFKNNEPQAWHSVYQPEVITLATLPARPLAGYRAIVINNLDELDAATRDRLDSFVRAGGGLWVALGEAVDRTWFNRDWYSDGDGLSPLGLESLEIIAEHDDVAATVHPPTRDHLATLQLANTTQLDIDEARIRERWLFAQRPAADAGFSALLESGNGHPLVVENYVGQGRVLVQGFPLGLEWSNLPLLKAYVVMIHDWLAYVTAPTMARYNLSPGAPILASAPKDVAGASAALITPRGREIALMALDGDGSTVFRYTQTQLPGDYRVRFTSEGAPLGDVPFHVSYDASESTIDPLAEVDRNKLLVPAGVQFSGANAPALAKSDSAPRREPFWGILLAGLVALLVCELLLSTWLARQRTDLTVSTT